MAGPKPPPGYRGTPKDVADLSGVLYQRVLMWGREGVLPCVEEDRRRWYPREAIAKIRELVAEEERTSLEAATREWTAFEDGVQAIETALAAGRTAVSILETVLRESIAATDKRLRTAGNGAITRKNSSASFLQLLRSRDVSRREEAAIG